MDRRGADCKILYGLIVQLRAPRTALPLCLSFVRAPPARKYARTYFPSLSLPFSLAVLARFSLVTRIALRERAGNLGSDEFPRRLLAIASLDHSLVTRA